MAYLISDQKGIHLFIYFVSITGMISLGLQHLLGKVFHRQKKIENTIKLFFSKMISNFGCFGDGAVETLGLGKEE